MADEGTKQSGLEELAGHVGRLQQMLADPQPGLSTWHEEVRRLLTQISLFAPAPPEVVALVDLATELIGYLSGSSPRTLGTFKGEVARDYARRLEAALDRLRAAAQDPPEDAGQDETRLPWFKLTQRGWMIAAMNQYRQGGLRKLFVVVVMEWSRPGRTRRLVVQYEGIDVPLFWKVVDGKCLLEEAQATNDWQRSTFFGMLPADLREPELLAGPRPEPRGTRGEPQMPPPEGQEE